MQCIMILALVLTYLATSLAENHEPVIHEGVEAFSGQFGWHVGLIIFGQSMQFCAGAVISPDWILTAAQCVFKADKALVYYRTNDLENVDVSVALAEKFIPHEEFDVNTLRHDIGLVKLKSPIVFDELVQPVILAEKELPPDKALSVSSWSFDNNLDLIEKHKVLYYIAVKTLNHTECQQFYGEDVVVHPEMTCVDGGVPVDHPCAGDGGNPVVLDHSNIHVAILSFNSSFGCTKQYAAAYTKTQYYRAWIKQNSGV